VRVRVLVVALALLVASACSNGDGKKEATGSTDTDALCRAFLSGDDAQLKAAAGGASETELLNRIELNCDRHPETKLRRRVAAPADVAVSGLTLCDTLPVPPVKADPKSGITIFGDLTEADPYAGRMLAVIWNPASGDNHAGDGTTTPVKVRGHDGVAAPITVFQQTILPELGTVIAWSEDGMNFGLYGRGWSVSQRGELVRMANSLHTADGGYAIEFLPDGFGRVYTGSSSATSLFLMTASPLYLEHFKGERGLLDLGGFAMSAEEFETFRFFTTDVKRQRVNNRDALVGTAWGKDGPSVVTWREPDGLVIRIVGIGVPLDKALALAAATRELGDGEWIHVVEHDVDCAS
jgi:hypothetical protein